MKYEVDVHDGAEPPMITVSRIVETQGLLGPVRKVNRLGDAVDFRGVHELIRGDLLAAARVEEANARRRRDQAAAL